MTEAVGRVIRSAAVVLVLLAGTACGGPGNAAGGGERGTVTVLAAASLTESFTRIAEEFRHTHPNVRVSLSFAGSSQLARQIEAGAPADVFAAADTTTMRTVTGSGRAAGQPRLFARNRLVIAVPEGNPSGIRGPADLVAAGVRVAVCAPQVPCGAAARRALDAAGVTLTPVSLEQDVKAALAKVRLGEVDAALVYATDTQAVDDDVDTVEFPEPRTVNDYLIVALSDAPNPPGAEAFVAYVLSQPARQVLLDAGFAVP